MSINLQELLTHRGNINKNPEIKKFVLEILSLYLQLIRVEKFEEIKEKPTDSLFIRMLRG